MEHDHYGRPVTRQPRRHDMPYGDYEGRRRYSRSPRRESRRPKPDYFRDEPKKERRGFGQPISIQPMAAYPVGYPQMPPQGAPLPPPPHGGPSGYPGGPYDDYEDDYPRDWSTGLFDCTVDTELCMCVCMNPIYPCMVMEEFEESFCLPLFMANGLLPALRARERDRYNIEGSMLNDCLVSTICTPCAFCQLVREVRVVRAELNNEVYPPPKRDDDRRRRSQYYDDDRYDDRPARGRREPRDSYYDEDPYAKF